jgi:microcystin-dependent protein
MDPYIGEIRMFAGNFAPRGWALCNGQLLSIAQNTALFSLLGTMYGGNGQTTFGLPDLRGRVPLHFGQGPGLTPYAQGELSGSETVTLTTNEMPSHNHGANGNQAGGNSPSPAGRYWAMSSRRDTMYASSANVAMQPQALDLTGNGQPHDNMQPYLTVNYIIALQGLYPPRS